MKIHKEGHNIILTVFFLLVLFNIGFCFFTFHVLPHLFILIVSVYLFFFITNFFKNPNRVFIGNTKNIIISPADGKIVAIKEVFEHDFFQEKKIQVSIFMGLSNAHVNWIPVDGKVTYYAHQNGQYQAAYLPKSSIKNERSTIIIKNYNEEYIIVRQVAGLIARRIITYIKPNQECKINEQLGFIKFGSRVDLFLPLTSKILVSLEQIVQGNRTIIAHLK